MMINFYEHLNNIIMHKCACYGGRSKHENYREKCFRLQTNQTDYLYI